MGTSMILKYNISSYIKNIFISQTISITFESKFSNAYNNIIEV